jgi:hypothetical protein
MRETVTLYDGNVKLIFDDKKHRYTASVLSEKGGWSKPLWVPSVTGITGIIDDGKSGALMGWATGLAVESIRNDIMEVGFDELDEVSLDEILIKGRWANKTYVKNAAKVGNIVHEYAEAHIKAHLGLGDAPKLPRNKKAKSGIDAFLQWESEAKPEYIFSERRIYAVDGHYAGTLDIGARIDGALTVADLKTSKNVYDEYKYQLAAYVHALNQEFNTPYERRLILHLSQEGGEFTPHDLEKEAGFTGVGLEADIECFLHAREVYRRVKEMKE